MSITINLKMLHQLSFSVDEIERFLDRFPKGLEITCHPNPLTVAKLAEALDTHKFCVQFFGREDPKALALYCGGSLVYAQRAEALRVARDRAALRRAHKNAALDLAWIGWRHLATWGGT